MTSIYDRLSQALRELLEAERIKAHVNQTEFANRVGLTQPTISKIEKGDRYIMAAEIVVFFEALDLDPLKMLKKAMVQAKAGMSVRKPQARKVKRRATKPK